MYRYSMKYQDGVHGHKHIKHKNKNFKEKHMFLFEILIFMFNMLKNIK